MRDPVLIIAACRTPIGSFRGGLRSIPAFELAGVVIKEALKRAGIDGDKIDEVILGQSIQAGCGQAPARRAALNGGLSECVPCTTVNKVCSSGLKSVSLAAAQIWAGQAEAIVAGGFESMSNVPYYLPRGETPYGGITAADGILVDGLTDPTLSRHMGDCTEDVVTKLGITRQQQDDFAVSSYQRALAAQKNGAFTREIVPVTVKVRSNTTVVSVDEGPAKANFDKMSSLKPTFKPGGTITAANASSLNDGAAAIIVTSIGFSKDNLSEVLAEVLDTADAARDPASFSIAPELACRKLLERNHLKVDDIALWEINEAFAAAGIANIRLLGLNPDKVNIDGGAVALGHPIGMSGARIVMHLAYTLKPGELGIATTCNGGGGASAILLRGWSPPVVAPSGL